MAATKVIDLETRMQTVVTSHWALFAEQKTASLPIANSWQFAVVPHS